MFRTLSAMALLYALLTTPALAQNYVVEVHGIVCEFCAFGVAKKVRKLSFIDASQFDHGVKVDIKNQQVFVAVREDATLDQKALFDAIESGGYNPIRVSPATDATPQKEAEQ